MLADAVLVAHFCIALFIVGGLGVIVVGSWRRWRVAGSVGFRVAHFAAIAVVVAESWFGITCPLTTLETWLRARAGVVPYSGGFIQHWLSRLLFYEAPAWAFVMAYSLFGLLVVASWWCFPSSARRSRLDPVA